MQHASAAYRNVPSLAAAMPFRETKAAWVPWPS